MSDHSWLGVQVDRSKTVTYSSNVLGQGPDLRQWCLAHKQELKAAITKHRGVDQGSRFY